MKGFGPADPLHTPRYAGVSTFLRLPHTLRLEDVDVAFLGLPFDGEPGVRAGARFGPKAIREASLTLRPQYNPSQRVAVFERLSVIDYGDAHAVPGFAERSFDKMAETIRTLHAAGIVPIGLGGDHSVLLPELRAAATTHGPLALLLFDARVDHLAEDCAETPGHCTLLERAVDEQLLDPTRSTVLGLRGGTHGVDDIERLRAMGYTIVAWDELAQLGTGAVAAAVDRSGGKAFLSVDVNFVDPAFAPGTGAPVCGGPTSMQALALLRGCRGLEIVGADVVEVFAELDTSHLTALLAATVAWETLSLIAAARPAGEDQLSGL